MSMLNCHRFAELGYNELVAPVYRRGRAIANDLTLTVWLARGRNVAS